MRIGLNLLHALPEIGGGWTYIRNLLSAIARDDDRNEYVAFATPVSAELIPAARNFRRVLVPLPSRVRSLRGLFENTFLQLKVRRERLDCLHWFANIQGIVNLAPPVVTIHDLQPFLNFATMPPLKRRFLRSSLQATVRNGATLLPVSQATANSLREILGARADSMYVIPPVLEPVFVPAEIQETEACRTRYNLPANFWLYVAHMYPHKNHERLLRAYAAVKRRQAHAWPLVLRGEFQPGVRPLDALVRELGLQRDVIILPPLKRAELPALYGAATVLVFPSLYEGAGLPILEAQACGCPVVASDIPAIREFAGDAAEYFDPRSEAEIENAMVRIASNPEMRDRLKRLGLEQARLVRQEPVVERLLEAYERASRQRTKN